MDGKFKPYFPQKKNIKIATNKLNQEIVNIRTDTVRRLIDAGEAEESAKLEKISTSSSSSLQSLSSFRILGF